MKTTTLNFLFLIMATILHAQEIKISFAPTINFAFTNPSVVGSPSQNSKAGFSSSFDYIFRGEKRINIGMGLCYQLSQLQFVPNLNSGNLLLHTEKVNLLSIYLRSVYKLRKSYYFSLDPSVGFHLNHSPEQTLDKQTGLGLALGIGKNIKISEIIGINIEPRLWIHNIIPFQDENTPYHLTIAGLNMGLVIMQKKIHTLVN